MSAVIYFVITIGILVFVHEFGHFIAAKISKMRVDVFAIGFGPRLLGWNKLKGFTFGKLPKDFDGEGNTDYRVCLLPLGGYVKIAGMIDESMDTDFVDKEPEPYEFRAASTPKKIFVITAGVLMNLLLAVAIFWGVNLFSGKSYTESTTISYVEEGSYADSSGFQTGDKILTVNGTAVQYWEDVRNQIYVETLGKDLNIEVMRDGKRVNLDVPRKYVPEDKTGVDYFVVEGLKPVITDVLKNSPADSAGIEPDDIFLKIEGSEVYAMQQVISMINSSPGEELDLTLQRESDTTTVDVVPAKDGKIGIILGGYVYMGPTASVDMGFFESLWASFDDIVRITDLTFSMFGKVVSGDVEFGKVFGGPVKIAQFAAKTADTGFISFITFLAMLSLSLAIINILPFPVLDGGHLIIIIIEGIMGRELNPRIKIAIQNTGFIILLLLMAFIIYSDIVNL